jgi:predicted metalloprotease with PDZ domain
MRIPTVLLPLLLVPAALPAQQCATEYDVSFPNAVHHEARIVATFRGAPADRPLELWMSRSSPGRYALHEFAKNVHDLRATDASGRPLELSHPDPYHWTVEARGEVKVAYTLFGDRADGTYDGIDNTHAHLNMPATFLWARGLEERPFCVTFRAPDPSWKVATQLQPSGAPGRYTAPHMQYFMDSPTEISDHRLLSWSEPSPGGAETIRMALHSQATDAEAAQYLDWAKRIVAEQKAVYGELPRYDYGSYTFLADYLPWVAGDGMEHRNSTVIISTRPLSTGALPNAATLAHEYFHSWNMERIRSQEIEPFDFTRADMSGALWFGEGFTQYYTDLPLKRAGLIPLEEFAHRTGRTVNAVVNSPGRRFRTPVEMSRLAPFVDAATSIDPNDYGNTFISYYTWGAALGLGLDLTLREHHGKTLDDYMRTMWREYGSRQANETPQRPYTIDDLRRTLGEVAGDTAFANDFFRRFVNGREVPDYAALLAPAGLLLRPANPGKPWLGGDFRVEEGHLVMAGAARIGTPLYDAGLDAGAVLTSADGRPLATAEELAAVLAAHHPGDAVPVTFELRGEHFERSLTLAADPTLEIVTFEEAGRPVSPAIARFREAWLGSHAR